MAEKFPATRVGKEITVKHNVTVITKFVSVRQIYDFLHIHHCADFPAKREEVEMNPRLNADEELQGIDVTWNDPIPETRQHEALNEEK